MTPLAVKTPTPAEKAFADAFASLEGADGARLQSWANFAAAGLPHRRVEEWKYSDLRSALRESDLPLALNAIGFSPPPAARYLLDTPLTGPMPALAASMAGAADFYTLRGKAEPVWIEINVPAGAAHHRVIEIEVEAGATAFVLEAYRVEDGAFINVAVRYRLGEGATLERIVRQEDDGDGVIVATAEIVLAANATLNQTTLAFGARLARLETNLTHEGEGASARMDGAYLLTGRRHADLTSVVRHAVPNCRTSQVVKGAVDQRGQGVFQGRFVVERGADGTDARMRHAAILLDDGAQANAKPELLIYADDVQCAHGNTVGALDADALFYMRSRGLTEADARALLIEAHVAAAFEGATNENAKDQLLMSSRNWLDAMRARARKGAGA
jgi:Fe-S cluster assembly protein SufD